jgi:hypothetical protein
MAYPADDPIWAVEDTYSDGVTENKIRPDESLRDYGYLPDAEPTAQELNWQLNNIYQQIVELKSLALGAYETPVNELKIIVGDNRDPSIIYGYGVWVKFAQGRTLIGSGTTTDTNNLQKSFPSESSGGTFENTISNSQLPQHSHSYQDSYYFENAASVAGVPTSNKQNVGFINGGWGSGRTDQDNNTLVFRNGVTDPVGSNQAVNNVQPYTVVNIWRRIS